MPRLVPYPWTWALLAALGLLGVGGSAPGAAAQDGPKEEAAQATCPDCSGNLDASGWCGKCSQGVARGLKTKCKSCLAAIGTDGWCADCKVGYVGGNKTRCESCFEAMSSADGAWCPDCSVGYAKGLKTKCKSCFAAMTSEDGGWCENCGVGYAKGLQCVCRSCFDALVKDGWCEGCSVGYVAGKKTSCKGCYGLMDSAEGGWCPDCKVGHAKGLKTRCRSCLAAIQADGACEDCGVRFREGRSFKKVALHVHWDEEQFGATERVRKVLSARKEVSALAVDGKSGNATFELETTKGALVDGVLAALRKAGFEAHPAGEEEKE